MDPEESRMRGMFVRLISGAGCVCNIFCGMCQFFLTYISLFPYVLSVFSCKRFFYFFIFLFINFYFGKSVCVICKKLKMSVNMANNEYLTYNLKTCLDFGNPA